MLKSQNPELYKYKYESCSNNHGLTHLLLVAQLPAQPHVLVVHALHFAQQPLDLRLRVAGLVDRLVHQLLQRPNLLLRLAPVVLAAERLHGQLTVRVVQLRLQPLAVGLLLQEDFPHAGALRVELRLQRLDFGAPGWTEE